MSTLIVALLSAVGFIVAYNTYGRWLGRRIFQLDPDANVPSKELQDDVDFIPTRRSVIFGHHFTSIAGTGPIVGPAIAVFWGWLPALLWVIFGSILIGAVHDFSALVISLRNRGQTVGEIAGRVISKRARVLFLLILFFALTMVIAIFGLVIAIIFKLYPSSVLAVWISLPIAIGIGVWSRKSQHQMLVPSLFALLMIYAAIYMGVYHFPIQMPEFSSTWNPIVIWTLILLAYCFVASVLPVWVLLQPRDYINSHQLLVAMALMIAGLAVASLIGVANLTESAPAIAVAAPADAPPILPFLFITIACGAVSGFHCLVSSGTSSKQIACETDARAVGYGAMLLEGGLAVLVILACCAGIGMGKFELTQTDAGTQWVEAIDPQTNTPLVGRAAWEYQYSSAWAKFKLPQTVGAFVEGGANFLTALGIHLPLAIGIIAVLVACFAATTLDTATRLQRYVLQELADTMRIKPLTNKYLATATVVSIGGALAMLPGGPEQDPGTGGTILWPLFGATNQLLAGLACMVVVFYLWRRNQPIWFAAIPMVVMMIMPAWALLWQLFNSETGFLVSQKWLLLTFGFAVLGLQVWMVIEAAMIWKKSRGVLEESLPPLPSSSGGKVGRSC